jgi:hypothetical protein
MSLPFKILPTDTRFETSPDVGESDCICSRCAKPIDEDEVPIRAWPEDCRFEYRFHPECLGFQTFDGVLPYDDHFQDSDDFDPNELGSPDQGTGEGAMQG